MFNIKILIKELLYTSVHTAQIMLKHDAPDYVKRFILAWVGLVEYYFEQFNYLWKSYLTSSL